jgi:DNA-binding CsgD family transcriptional regulator
MHDCAHLPVDMHGLLLRLYRLSQELPIDHFQDAALAQLRLLLPFDSAIWGTATTAKTGIDIHNVHLLEKSPDMVAAYQPLKHVDSAAASVFGKPRTTLAFNSSSWFCGSKDQELLAFMRRFEQNNFFITAENDPHTRLMHWITLYRANPEAHCTETERATLEQVAPHLLQAIAFNRVMHLQKVDMLDPSTPSRGAAIADARGLLYHAEPQFMQLAQREWNDWRGPYLPGPLQKALTAQNATYTGHTLVVRGHLEHGLLFLRTRMRCPADQLSPREWIVAQHIAKGQSYKEIAQILHSSPHTVRNQIQAIHQKLQVDNIAKLIDALRQST